jgi:hypothetical protein
MYILINKNHAKYYSVIQKYIKIETLLPTIKDVGLLISEAHLHQNMGQNQNSVTAMCQM